MTRSPRKPSSRATYSGIASGPAQACAAGNCPEPGEYKAPLSRNDTEHYQYLCLEHVREFNRAWDYFDGWERDAIEQFSHDANFGHRPTWKIGTQPLFTSDTLRDRFFRMMGEEPPPDLRAPAPRVPPKIRAAYAVLGLTPEASLPDMKSAYKKLVKKYHPDVNKDDKAAEEAFKRVTAAYKLLLTTPTAG